MNEKYVVSYDVGTTGVKTCLFKIDSKITLVGAAMESYNLYILPDGGAEQDPDEWWSALCSTTKAVFKKCKVRPDAVEGISFCSQMQGLVLVDRDGVPVRRAFSYMDQRARKQLREGLAHGFRIAGANVFKLLPALAITGAVAASVKDPVWKYNWVRENEPENFKRVYKWLDVKEYIIFRMTNRFVMTRDSAFAALLYDIRKGRWSERICRLYGVEPESLPEIVDCADKVGELTLDAAEDLGLKAGAAVFGGGGDASLIGVGAGSVEPGETHIYCGTSGWVSTVVEKSVVDASAMIAAVLGAQNGRFNYFAELETAGKCLEWVKDHLALDEIGVFLKKTHVAESPEALYTNLYEYLSEVIEKIPAGSAGVIFTPWLHGNRCPFEDPNARGMFFNVGLDVGKTELIRSVIEGVCFHLRWFLETQDKKIKTSRVVRFVGGGALSDSSCQILADATGRTIETVDNPQNVGAVGAAVVSAVGLGLLEDVSQAKKLIPVKKTFYPNEKNRSVYDRNYSAFKLLYKNNKKAFKVLNG